MTDAEQREAARQFYQRYTSFYDDSIITVSGRNNYYGTAEIKIK